MTYRELLRLYKQGKLEDSAKKQIEAEIEKQDAISEFLYEEGEIPDFSDLENEQGCFNGLNDETQKTERQNSKNNNSIEEQQRNQPEKQEEAFNEQFMKEIRHSIRKAFIKMGTIVGAVVLIFVLCAVFILPKAVSKFYYDPNEAAGAYEGMTTTRMSLDLSVYSEELGATIGEALLTPTRIYVKPLSALMQAVQVKAAAHITGGGFYENIPRCLPKGLSAKIERRAVEVLPVFHMIQRLGDIPERDMFNTFNMGVGMCVVVPQAEADAAVRSLEASGVHAYALGEVVPGEGVAIC